MAYLFPQFSLKRGLLIAGLSSIPLFSPLLAATSNKEDAYQDRPSFFQQEGYKNEAARYLGMVKQLSTKSKAHTRILMKNAYQAKQQGKAGLARSYFTLAAGKSGGYEAWLEIARFLSNTHTTSYRQYQTNRKNAISAAQLAFKTAEDKEEEFQALKILAKTLVRQNQWVYAIEAYKSALARKQDAHVTASLNNLISKHGFRILKHTVASDALAPRACIHFSDAPHKAARLENYIVVEASNPTALSLEGKQICIDGLKHGEKFKARVRPEFRNIYGERLQNKAELDIYVKDRSPSLRFTGKNYVLPATGQHGIPVVSVNLESADFTLYRVGDRGLSQMMVKPQYKQKLFGNQMNGQNFKKLGETLGQKIWTGSLEIKNKLNKDTTTSLPISQILTKTTPGVYVLQAKVPNKKTDKWSKQPTQWFIISDLGLTAFKGQDGINIFARSLSTANPVEKLNIKLIAKNNEVLGEAQSNEHGHVHFPAGLARGEGGLRPSLLIAQKGAHDYAFLDLSANGFDLSDRGVAGRKAPGPLDAYLYTERGVYKAGATVHIASLLRDDKNQAATLPLTLIINRPDGVEHQRVILKDSGLGGRTHDLKLLESAQTGTWSASIHADPKQNALAKVNFLVEDFVPERLKMSLKTKKEIIAPTDQINMGIEAAYLYGAPAKGLSIEGSLSLRQKKTPYKGFVGYTFGRSDEKTNPVKETLSSLPAANKDGKANLKLALPALPDTSRPLEARVTVRLVETSGRSIERTRTLALLPAQQMIGIRPLFSSVVPEGEDASFMVTVMGTKGQPVSANNLKWELKKVEKRYQWYSQGGSWRYEPFTKTKRIATGVIKSDGIEPAKLSQKLDWGEYRLEVSSSANAKVFSSYTFNSGWYAADSSEDTPDRLEIGLEKASYKVGEQARLKVKARSKGQILLSVINDKLLWSQSVSVEKGENHLNIPVGQNWGAGAYVMATQYRPMNKKAKRMPARSLGIQWLAINAESQTLKVEVEAPASMKPDNKLVLPVSIKGLAKGEEAYVMAAVVDEGILNLTRYKNPAPDKWFLAQRQLGVEIRDLYGKLINGMQAEAGIIRQGGDGMGSGLGMNGAPRVEQPLSLFSGIVRLDENGQTKLSFDIPSFTGSIRVMTVAWSGSRTGHSVESTKVRDDVIMLGTLPRFMASGDTSRFHVSLNNVNWKSGDYQLNVSGNHNLVAGAGGIDTHSFKLDEKQSTSFNIPLKANGVGEGLLTATLSGPEGLTISRAYAFEIRPAYPVITKQILTNIQPDGFVNVSNDIFVNMVPNTGSVTMSVAPETLPDIPGLLMSLDKYPYGCSEQITSRALPLLYLSSLADQIGLNDKRDKKINARLQKAIDTLFSRQSSEGDFGLWNPGNGGLWLTSYVMDFLGRAKTEGFKVPASGYDNGLRYLSNALSYRSDLNKGARKLSYALYILAKNRKARIGDLRYYADEKLESFKSPLAKSHLAAALAMYGDKSRSETVFAAARQLLRHQNEGIVYGTYGSRLGDAAATLTLISETGSLSENNALAKLIADLRENETHATTQEKAWLLMAAHAVLEETGNLNLSVNGKDQKGPLHTKLKQADLQQRDVKVENKASVAARMSISYTGAPVTAEPATSNGFDIERLYFTLDGKAVRPDNVKQNTRLVTMVRVHEHDHKPGELMIADYLPAGFEIENPRLVTSGATKQLSWLPKSEASPVHTEFRDHRFTAAFSLGSGKAKTLVVAYIIRAVAPGTYAHPPAIIEDMYRPERTARTEAAHVTIK